MPQRVQRLGFNLANALAGHTQLLADFFQGMVSRHINPEPHPQHFSLALSQSRQHFASRFAQTFNCRRIHWRHHIQVLNEITQMRIFIVANGCFH